MFQIKFKKLDINVICSNMSIWLQNYWANLQFDTKWRLKSIFVLIKQYLPLQIPL